MPNKSPNSPPKKPERYTAEQVIKAVQEGRGIVHRVAQLLACDPDTVRNYAKRYVTVAAALVEAREGVTDMAEAALIQAIGKGEPWAVCFYLKTQGKGRGYVERQEVTGKDGGPVQVQTFADLVAAAHDE